MLPTSASANQGRSSPQARLGGRRHGRSISAELAQPTLPEVHGVISRLSLQCRRFLQLSVGTLESYQCDIFSLMLAHMGEAISRLGAKSQKKKESVAASLLEAVSSTTERLEPHTRTRASADYRRRKLRSSQGNRATWMGCACLCLLPSRHQGLSVDSEADFLKPKVHLPRRLRCRPLMLYPHKESFCLNYQGCMTCGLP